MTSPVRIGSYQLLGELAQGGMGGTSDRRVAKVPLSELDEDPELAHMVLEDARIAASIDYDNVVRIRDMGRDEGVHHDITDYIKGSDVRGWPSQRFVCPAAHT